MTGITFNDGESYIPQGRDGGSFNTGEPLRDDIEASAGGPVDVKFYRRDSGIAMTPEEATKNPKHAYVPYGGSQSSLQALLNAGLVARNPETGSYYDTRGHAPAARSAAPEKTNALSINRGNRTGQQEDSPEDWQQKEDEPDPLAGFTMSEEGGRAVKEVQGLYADHAETIDHAVTVVATKGTAALSDEQLFRDINAATGKSAEESRATMAAAMTEYTAAANHAIKDFPVGDPQAVWNWVWQARPALASEMVYRQLSGDFSKHHEAAREYLGTLDKYDPQTCLNADLGPNAKAVKINGQILVEWNGKQYPWRDALQLGGII